MVIQSLYLALNLMMIITGPLELDM